MDWQKLESPEAVENIKSNDDYVLIYKHSYRCEICHKALDRIENQWDNFPYKNSVTPHFINVITEREISNKVASEFNVPHKSPQLLLIKGGKVIHDASHGGVEINSLSNLITH